MDGDRVDTVVALESGCFNGCGASAADYIADVDVGEFRDESEGGDVGIVVFGDSCGAVDVVALEDYGLIFNVGHEDVGDEDVGCLSATSCAAFESEPCVGAGE